jgi:hypothetical protein
MPQVRQCDRDRSWGLERGADQSLQTIGDTVVFTVLFDNDAAWPKPGSSCGIGKSVADLDPIANPAHERLVNVAVQYRPDLGAPGQRIGLIPISATGQSQPAIR